MASHISSPGKTCAGGISLADVCCVYVCACLCVCALQNFVYGMCLFLEHYFCF